MCDFTSVVLGPAGPDYPAVEEVFPPFYWGSFTYGPEQATGAAAATGVKSPYHP